MKMKEIAKESLGEIQQYLELDYEPVQAWVEDFEGLVNEGKEIESLTVEWSDGNEMHSIEANQNLNELVDMIYIENPLDSVLTFAEATEKWGLGNSTLRESVRNDRFQEGEVRKSGNTWLVTYEAMKRLYGEPKK